MKKTTVYRRPMDENLFEEELTIEALSAMAIGFAKRNTQSERPK